MEPPLRIVVVLLAVGQLRWTDPRFGDLVLVRSASCGCSPLAFSSSWCAPTELHTEGARPRRLDPACSTAGKIAQQWSDASERRCIYPTTRSDIHPLRTGVRISGCGGGQAREAVPQQLPTRPGWAVVGNCLMATRPHWPLLRRRLLRSRPRPPHRQAQRRLRGFRGRDQAPI